MTTPRLFATDTHDTAAQITSCDITKDGYDACVTLYVAGNGFNWFDVEQAEVLLAQLTNAISEAKIANEVREVWDRFYAARRQQ